MVKNILFPFIIIAILVSCKPDPIPEPNEPVSQARILVNPTYGQYPLYLDSIYQGPNGIRIKISDIKFFTTLMTNGNNTFAEVGYFDYREKGNVMIEQEGDYSKFPSLSFILGVDTSLNHDDPSAFPNNSPLNIINSGSMHWGWNTGYIFISVEGKADTLNDGVDNFDLSYSYHVGTDWYQQAMTFSNLSWTKTGTNEHSLFLKLDMESFFFNPQQPIDIPNESFTHSGAGLGPLTQKVTINFKNALQPQ
ncbi:MAG: hypothetical protein K9I97_02430 [Cryomorphaceae bacterium]|jgi:hypothetical protein|nr:hypothetical protein [Cryomorphaceae bacterium]